MGSRQGFWKTKTVEVWQDNADLDFFNYHLQVEKGMQVEGELRARSPQMSLHTFTACRKRRSRTPLGHFRVQCSSIVLLLLKITGRIVAAAPLTRHSMNTSDSGGEMSLASDHLQVINVKDLELLGPLVETDTRY
jgi:hypothetical protein